MSLLFAESVGELAVKELVKVGERQSEESQSGLQLLKLVIIQVVGFG